MELRPLDESADGLLTSLQQQDDVWEYIGSAAFAAYEPGNHVFAIVEGEIPVGFAGLFKSHAAGRDDFEILCATRSDVQHRGVARRACQLLVDWALKTEGLERVIACIEESNHPARAIAAKLEMTELRTDASNRVIYVKYRDKHEPI
ncbi:MAG TPA: GNAT family N-acetyltransferase [Gemmatimonadaceae bacterium]|nr:GNAT family N-acetyltransferase [Gemmatimonadaceae bacterium]